MAQIDAQLPFAHQVSDTYVRLQQFPPRIQKSNTVKYYKDWEEWSALCRAELELAEKVTLTFGRAKFTVWNTVIHLEKFRDKILGPEGVGFRPHRNMQGGKRSPRLTMTPIELAAWRRDSDPENVAALDALLIKEGTPC